MNHPHCHAFIKITSFIVHEICFIITAITLFIGITYWNYDDATFNVIEQEDFSKTNYYKRLVEEHIYNLVSYVRSCEKFQTNQTTDTQRIVDIYDYVQNDRISGNATYSLGYRIQDLLDWKKKGFTYTAISENDASAQQLVESYQNTASLTLYDYAVSSQKDYSDVCATLESACNKLASEYSDYRSLTPSFKSGSTNLRYAISNTDTDQLYTNMDISDISEGFSYIQSMETHVTLNSQTADFDSSILYTNDQLSRYLTQIYTDSGNYIVAIGVDTDFPVLDSFHKEKLRYSTFENWFDTLYNLLIIGIIGYILTGILLSIYSGHSYRQSGIRLTFFEKLPLELMLLISGGTELIIWRQIMQEMNGFILPSINPATLVKLSLLSLMASLVLTICYLSFLRRFKSQTLYSGSICSSLVKWAKQLRPDRHLALRTILFYFLLCIATFCCILYTRRPLPCLTGALLIAISIFFMTKDQVEKKRLLDGLHKIADGDLAFQVDISHLSGTNRRLAQSVNQIRGTLHEAVEDSLKNERLKTNLITNVSHDIKTPLTSIINYVALLKGIPTTDEKTQQYLQILDDKSQRLKHLTEDLVEASKISSHNIVLEKTTLNFNELIAQTEGEFCERFQEKNLTLVTVPAKETIYIDADGRRIWRILENLYTNALKYSLKHSRVYAQLDTVKTSARFSLKNVSAQPLTVEKDELTKRFVRGDAARTTEGSGLGLSIAKDLTLMHDGTFDITVDGDLFSVTLTLPLSRATPDN